MINRPAVKRVYQFIYDQGKVSTADIFLNCDFSFGKILKGCWFICF